MPSLATLPWYVAGESTNARDIMSADGTVRIAHCIDDKQFTDRPLADAAFIVRACNAYDEMLAALRMADAELTTLAARLSEPYRRNAIACVKAARAAIKLAEIDKHESA